MKALNLTDTVFIVDFVDYKIEYKCTPKLYVYKRLCRSEDYCTPWVRASFDEFRVILDEYHNNKSEVK